MPSSGNLHTSDITAGTQVLGGQPWPKNGDPVHDLEENHLSAVGFRDAQRVHTSFLAAAEKRALIWMAERTPRFVNSDHLTLLGFAAQFLAGLCYALARWDRRALIAVVACMALNWFGDSLDGTLARVRKQQRPRYGFYVDHMMDSFGALFLICGLAISGYMHLAIAAGLLIAFLLLSIQSYLATYCVGEFHLSFWKFGPTEMRIILAIGNLALLWKPTVHLAGHGPYRLFDVGGLAAIAGMSFMLVFATGVNTRRLYRQEQIR
jgi:phosphatidylglycerophosphate synthase